MNIDLIPSQLHLNYHSDSDVSGLIPLAKNLFPDMENIELTGKTLNLYSPNELIEFIHISARRIGVIFQENIITSGAVESALENVLVLLSNLGIKEVKKYTWEYKFVKLYKTKDERDVASKALSPSEGYSAKVIVLNPDDKLGYYIRLSMVSKDKKEHGIMFNIIHEIPRIRLKDISTTLKKQSDEFLNEDRIAELIQGILGE